MNKSQKLAALFALLSLVALAFSPVVGGPLPDPDSTTSSDNFQIAGGPLPDPDSTTSSDNVVGGPLPDPDSTTSSDNLA